MKILPIPAITTISVKVTISILTVLAVIFTATAAAADIYINGTEQNETVENVHTIIAESDYNAGSDSIQITSGNSKKDVNSNSLTINSGSFTAGNEILVFAAVNSDTVGENAYANSLTINGGSFIINDSANPGNLTGNIQIVGAFANKGAQFSKNIISNGYFKAANIDLIGGFSDKGPIANGNSMLISGGSFVTKTITIAGASTLFDINDKRKSDVTNNLVSVTGGHFNSESFEIEGACAYGKDNTTAQNNTVFFSNATVESGIISFNGGHGGILSKNNSLNITSGTFDTTAFPPSSQGINIIGGIANLGTASDNEINIKGGNFNTVYLNFFGGSGLFNHC